MSITGILEVIGGMAIFLYGMFVMSDSIQKMAGEKVKSILLKLTGGRIKGYLTGLGTTCLVQASAATVIMEMSFVSAGLLAFSQTLAVTMGAQLGTTITAQLVAFKITKYALPIITVSFFITLFSRNNLVKNAAGLLLGFGILFLGIDIMSKALAPLRQYRPFLDLMAGVENPLLGILTGFLFTLITQSSSATSGVTVAMAFAGTITLNQAIPINLGASIGTTLTPFLGSIGLNREGKRVAWSHIFTQVIGVFIVYLLLLPRFHGTPLWIVIVKTFTLKVVGTGDTARQIAMAHSLMPLMTALVCLPLTGAVSAIMMRLFPSDEAEKPFKPRFITDTVVGIPALALDLSKKEILHMTGIVSEMLQDSIRIFEKKDRRLAGRLNLTDYKVDILRDAIIPFLTKVEKQDLSEKEKRTEIDHITIVSSVENIGDIIDKNIIPLARKMINRKLSFSEEGWKDICLLYQRVEQNFRDIVLAFRNADQALARKVVETKTVIGKFETELRMRHIARLHRGLSESMQTSSVHFDLIEQYKRINSTIVSFGYVILGQQ